MSTRPRVALFATCLVDLMRPSIGFAAARLLEAADCEVVVPAEQTCCGQPAYNNGADDHARRLARQLIGQFADFDYVVVPSGSCAGMIKVHYPRLLADDAAWRERAEALASRCYELTTFLCDVRGLAKTDSAYPYKVAYHDSCSGLRELGVKDQPRRLLSQVRGLELEELQDAEVCCGFGGTFCVKYPQVSVKIVSDKVANIERSGAQTVLGGDLGCLLNIAGRLRRQNKPIKVLHVAEVLAGRHTGPGIAAGD